MRAKTILLLLIALLFTSVVSAQTRYPKREFRGAWIQCVNGQFQGMPTEKIQRLLINQLNSLQGAGINAIIFRYVQKPMPCINLLMSVEPLSYRSAGQSAFTLLGPDAVHD